MKRRNFLKQSAAGVGAVTLAGGLKESASAALNLPGTIVDDFSRVDSLFHGEEWESLNPGYWKLKDVCEVSLQGTFQGELSEVPEGDQADWKMYPPGYGLIGLAIGGENSESQTIVVS